MKKAILIVLAAILGACNPITPNQSDPQISQVQPRIANPGDNVSISGSGFDAGATVKIGDQLASQPKITTTSITVAMPKLPIGDYTVIVTNPNGKSDTHTGPGVLASASQANTSVIEGEVLVTLDASIDKNKLDSFAKANGFIVKNFVPAQPGSIGACQKGYAVLQDTQSRTTKNAINELAGKSEVYEADPHTNVQGSSYLDSGPAQSQKPELEGIAAERANNYLQAKNINLSSIRVAVLDTGVSPHPDFFDASFKNSSLEAGQNFTDEDNVLDAKVGIEDVSDLGISQNAGTGGHGTGVAAIIAALDGNESPNANFLTPMVGGASGAKIVPVKVCTKDNKCLGLNVIAGVCYAIAQKVNIMNLSFGGDTSTRSLKAILETANSQGISLVAAAGNNGDSAPAHYPAAYSSSIDGLIAVGSATLGLTAPIWSGSDFSIPGAWVDLVAPGKGVFTATVNYNNSTRPYGYGNLEGTSFAAPWVSATAVLLKALNPSWTPAQIKTQIVKTAKPLSCSSVIKCGAGLLNMADALEAP